MVTGDAVLDAVLAAAVDVTQAGRGWLLAVTNDQLQVVAGRGAGAASRVGTRGPRQFGWAGFVVGAAQPVALVARPDDPRFLGDLVADPRGRPVSLLCFPCSFGGIAVGALQLQDKAGGSPFGLNDVELATYLAEVAGAAIAEMGHPVGTSIPTPAALGADLRALAAANPARYQAVATLVDELVVRS